MEEKEKIIEIEIERLKDFKEHPFQVKDDEEMRQSMKGDYFILPSSINEVIVVPDDGSLDHKELKEMVNEINHTQVAPEERLTDVYR